MLRTSSILSGLENTPWSVYTLLKNLIRLHFTVHLEEFRVRPLLCVTLRKCINLSLCCCSVSPLMIMSSLIPTDPLHCSMMVSMRCWKISLLTNRPNGSRMKQYLPNGVRNAVISCNRSLTPIACFCIELGEDLCLRKGRT